MAPNYLQSFQPVRHRLLSSTIYNLITQLNRTARTLNGIFKNWLNASCPIQKHILLLLLFFGFWLAGCLLIVFKSLTQSLDYICPPIHSSRVFSNFIYWHVKHFHLRSLRINNSTARLQIFLFPKSTLIQWGKEAHVPINTLDQSMISNHVGVWPRSRCYAAQMLIQACLVRDKK